MPENKQEDNGAGLGAMIVGFMVFIIFGEPILKFICLLFLWSAILAGSAFAIWVLWNVSPAIYDWNKRRERQKEEERVMQEQHRRQEKEQQEERERQERLAADQRMGQKYQTWLAGSGVDKACWEADEHVGKLVKSIGRWGALLKETSGRDITRMSQTSRDDNWTHIRLQRSSIETLKTSLQMWEERLAVLRFQHVIQRSLRSIPPWLGGTTLEERPKGTDPLWPTKPTTPVLALKETTAALDALEDVHNAQKALDQHTPWKWDEAQAHAQALTQRVRQLTLQLEGRVVECQVMVDRVRTSELLDESPTINLRAGELATLFPKDIEPMATDLLLRVPQDFDLEDKLHDLQRSVYDNIAHGRADHEVETIPLSPGGRVVPARRSRTSQ